ncbi:hypothetical protein [Microcella alkalica]|uniref:hypothetical protein n=1 Tax=Microcella alkalica TaxID=355930 RepID=UPI00145E2B7F|nr:hypothetical protein [Microcella alkalica]
MTTMAEALEVTLAADPIYSLPEQAAAVALARELARELDDQIATTGAAQTRTLATFAGSVNSLRRVLRDERDQARKTAQAPKGTATRLALIKQQAQQQAAS